MARGTHAPRASPSSSSAEARKRHLVTAPPKKMGLPPSDVKVKLATKRPAPSKDVEASPAKKSRPASSSSKGRSPKKARAPSAADSEDEAHGPPSEDEAEDLARFERRAKREQAREEEARARSEDEGASDDEGDAHMEDADEAAQADIVRLTDVLPPQRRDLITKALRDKDVHALLTPQEKKVLLAVRKASARRSLMKRFHAAQRRDRRAAAYFSGRSQKQLKLSRGSFRKMWNQVALPDSNVSAASQAALDIVCNTVFAQLDQGIAEAQDIRLRNTNPKTPAAAERLRLLAPVHGHLMEQTLRDRVEQLDPNLVATFDQALALERRNRLERQRKQIPAMRLRKRIAYLAANMNRLDRVIRDNDQWQSMGADEKETTQHNFLRYKIQFNKILARKARAKIRKLNVFIKNAREVVENAPKALHAIKLRISKAKSELEERMRKLEDIHRQYTRAKKEEEPKETLAKLSAAWKECKHKVQTGRNILATAEKALETHKAHVEEAKQRAKAHMAKIHGEEGKDNKDSFDALRKEYEKQVAAARKQATELGIKNDPEGDELGLELLQDKPEPAAEENP